MDSTEHLQSLTVLTPRTQQLLASLVGRGRVSAERAKEIFAMEDADAAGRAINEILHPGSADAAAVFLKDVGATQMTAKLDSDKTTA